jgi:hypothetical protein
MNVSFEDDANDDKENLYPWISSLYSSFHFKKEVNSWLFYKGQEQGTSAECYNSSASKSLVAPDGGILLVPAVVSDSKTAPQIAYTPWNVCQHVANSGSSGAGLGLVGTNVGGLQEMVMMMNSHIQKMLQCPFREINGDDKEAKANLVTAVAANHRDNIKFYQAMCNALEDELKSHH